MIEVICAVLYGFALLQIVDSRVLCVHGGLSPMIATVDQIQTIERVQEIPFEGPYCDILWSDPDNIEMWAINPRGAGYLFGGGATSQVSNNLSEVDLFLKYCDHLVSLV